MQLCTIYLEHYIKYIYRVQMPFQISQAMLDHPDIKIEIRNASISVTFYESHSQLHKEVF